MTLFSAPAINHVIGLLSAAGLPTEDLVDTTAIKFFGYGVKDKPSGVVGLEQYGEFGLLRSLLVVAGAQNQGVGKRLVRTVESEAVKTGISALYLLTETAEQFFSRLEYDVIARDQVPDAIRSSAQFSSLCPDSATVMVKRLTD